MSKATAKVSPKFLKEDDQDSVRKADHQWNILYGNHTDDQIEGCELIDA